MLRGHADVDGLHGARALGQLVLGRLVGDARRLLLLLGVRAGDPACERLRALDACLALVDAELELEAQPGSSVLERAKRAAHDLGLLNEASEEEHDSAAAAMAAADTSKGTKAFSL